MELVFATHNPHKVTELKALVPDHITIKSLTDIGCHTEIVEDANTFKGNALLKANYVTKHYGLPCFADDSGLEVHALAGAPGVFSARYAGKQNNANANMDKLLKALAPKSNRTAQFRTVIAYVNGKDSHFFEGICHGEILTQRQGDSGFGYDPIFLPKGYSQSFAQMTLEQKGAISHRGLAVSKLIAYLKETT